MRLLWLGVLLIICCSAVAIAPGEIIGGGGIGIEPTDPPIEETQPAGTVSETVTRPIEMTEIEGGVAFNGKISVVEDNGLVTSMLTDVTFDLQKNYKEFTTTGIEVTDLNAGTIVQPIGIDGEPIPLEKVYDTSARFINIIDKPSYLSDISYKIDPIPTRLRYRPYCEDENEVALQFGYETLEEAIPVCVSQYGKEGCNNYIKSECMKRYIEFEWDMDGTTYVLNSRSEDLNTHKFYNVSYDYETQTMIKNYGNEKHVVANDIVHSTSRIYLNGNVQCHQLFFYNNETYNTPQTSNCSWLNTTLNDLNPPMLVLKCALVLNDSAMLNCSVNSNSTNQTTHPQPTATNKYITMRHWQISFLNNQTAETSWMYYGNDTKLILENGQIFFEKITPSQAARGIANWLYWLNDGVTDHSGVTYMDYGYQKFTNMQIMESSYSLTGNGGGSQMAGFARNATINGSVFMAASFSALCVGIAYPNTLAQCTLWTNASYYDSAIHRFSIAYFMGPRPIVNTWFDSVGTGSLFTCGFAECEINMSNAYITAPCLGSGFFAALMVNLQDYNPASWILHPAANGEAECYGATTTNGDAQVRIYNTYQPRFTDNSLNTKKPVYLRNLTCYNNDSKSLAGGFSDLATSINYTSTYIDQLQTPMLYFASTLAESHTYEYYCKFLNDTYLPWNNVSILPSLPVYNNSIFPMMAIPYQIIKYPGSSASIIR